MKMPKPTDDDRNYFRSLIPDDPEVEIKPMFGNLAAFANGQMFAGLLGASVGLRLDEPAYGELSAVAGAGGFGPGEKPMTGYVGLPAAWRDTPAMRAGAVWAVDANGHFSRPGPRLVDGLETLAAILHPELFRDRPDPRRAARVGGLSDEG